MRTTTLVAYLMAAATSLVLPRLAASQETPPAPDSSPAAQEAEDDYSRPGFYVGAHGSYSFQKFDLPGFDVEDSWGVGGRVGYRLHPVLATELVVDGYLGFDVEDAVSIKGQTVMAVAKLYSGLIPGRVQPYASLGLGIANFELEEDESGATSDNLTEFATRFGGGVDIYITEKILLNAEAVYLSANGSLNGLDFVPILWGVQYRF